MCEEKEKEEEVKVSARELYQAEWEERWADTYMCHELVEHRTDGKDLNAWRLARPKGSEFWVEIVSLRSGTILVHGDTDPVLFRFYSGHYLSLLNTIRRSGIDYLAQKARMGNTNFKDRVYNVDVLREDVEDVLNDEDADLGEEEREVLVAVLEDGVDETDWENGILSELYNHADVEYYIDFGRVYSTTLYQARAAVRKLVQIIEKK